MKASISKTQPWISTTAKLLHTDKVLNIRVNIMNNSIAKSFLILEDPSSKSFSFIPISGEISISFSSTKIFFCFTKFDNFSLCLEFENMLDMELVVSHFGRCALLFNDTLDMFKKENFAFLKSLQQPPEKPFLIPIEAGRTTILSPIVLSKTAKSIWEKGVIQQNLSFITSPRVFRFSFLTWNIAGNHPLEETKKEFERVFSGNIRSNDIVCIALEELEMSVKSVVTGSSDFRKGWTEIIQQAPSIGENPDYELIFVDNVGTIFIAVLVKKDLMSIIHVDKSETLKLGAGGLLANKAAILLPFRIGECKIKIAACHLTAHEQNFEERNQQIREILDAVGNDVDYFFFLGDLNYRITLPYEEAIELCKHQKIDQLLQSDQLRNIQRKDKKIAELIEPEITFLPTYKFDENSDEYDTSSKKRTPSYTDRILSYVGQKRLYLNTGIEPVFETDVVKHFITDPGYFTTDCNSSAKTVAPNYPFPPTCVCYRSLQSKFSDHRPVHALYKVTCPIIKKEKVEELNAITRAKYEELKQLSTPCISIEPVVLLKKPGQKNYQITLKNQSLVWAHFALKNVTGKIIVTPAAGTLLAGDSTNVNIDVNDDFDENSTFFFISLTGGEETKIKVVKDTQNEENDQTAEIKLKEHALYHSLPFIEENFNSPENSYLQEDLGEVPFNDNDDHSEQL